MNIPVRKILTITLFLLASVLTALAQGTTEKRDSVIYRQSAAMDSTLVGKNIFNLLSGYGGGDSKVTVHQSQRILNAFESHVAANSSRTYRTYSNPFFRVTVGDFRTKSEAMQLLQQVKGAFPTAFIVRETIGYPVVDRFHSYTVETVNQE